MSDRDLHPTEGARYLFERVEEGRVRARYRAMIYTPDAVFSCDAVLGEDGSVDLSPSDAPTELRERLTSIAKLIARDASRLRADGMPPWPGRIMRWRK